MSTNIEWASDSWNPIAGCSIVSKGCEQCYAMKDAHWLASNPNPKIAKKYEGTTRKTRDGRVIWTGRINEARDEVFTIPIRKTRPRMYFVNSMSDLFHENMPFQTIDRVVVAMMLGPQHIYQILTKRADRMRDYLSSHNLGLNLARVYDQFYAHNPQIKNKLLNADLLHELTNIWWGVSAENQETANERIPILLDTPAAVRWVSAEPLLGPIDFEPFLQYEPLHENYKMTFGFNEWRGLDWVVPGGESCRGGTARECDQIWIHKILEQCKEAGTPAFVKQAGQSSTMGGVPWNFKHKKGGDITEWEPQMQVREFPKVQK